jgi:hypothetical protein
MVILWSDLLHDWRFAPISFSWRHAPWDSRSVIFSQLNTCGHSPCVTSILTRWWVCRLKLALALASAVILRLKTLLTWRARPPCLYPPGTGWSDYIPRHWIPFPSPRTTRRITVELIDPASTRDFWFWRFIWTWSPLLPAPDWNHRAR